MAGHTPRPPQMNEDRKLKDATRDYIAELYRTTDHTQERIAQLVGVCVSEVNTAISLKIPLHERAQLVSKRRRNARQRELAKDATCPHCGKPLFDVAHPQPVYESGM